jgi:predicted HTH domain antitoxin
MEVKVAIPDELFNDQNGDPSSRILEAFALEGFKSGQLTTAQVRRLLGFETRMQVHEFLKAHGVPWVNYSVEDAERERELLQRVLL